MNLREDFKDTVLKDTILTAVQELATTATVAAMEHTTIYLSIIASQFLVIATNSKFKKT